MEAAAIFMFCSSADMIQKYADSEAKPPKVKQAWWTRVA